MTIINLLAILLFHLHMHYLKQLALLESPFNFLSLWYSFATKPFRAKNIQCPLFLSRQKTIIGFNSFVVQTIFYARVKLQCSFSYFFLLISRLHVFRASFSKTKKCSLLKWSEQGIFLIRQQSENFQMSQTSFMK